MSKIKLEVGMRTKCAMYGEGQIYDISKDRALNLLIDFNNDLKHYTNDGRYLFHTNPTLKLLNIPFTEGLEVECEIYGNGVVSHINNDPIKPIGVKFDIDLVAYYTTSGCISPNANQTLYPKFTI